MDAPTPPGLAGRSGLFAGARHAGPGGSGPRPSFIEFVVLSALMMGLTAFGVDNVLPAFPVIGATFGVSDPNDVQLLVYIYMLGFGLTQLVYGPLSDVIGRRPAFLAGLAIFLVGCGMAIFATGFTSLLVARFVQGTGAAAGRVIAIAIVRDRFVGREMARVMSLTMMVFIMVPVFAPAIGGAILAFADWHGIFGAMLLLGAVLGVWFVRRMPETLAPENQMAPSAARILGGVRTAVTSRATVGYATAFGCLFGCIMSMVGSAQQILGEAYGLGTLFPLAFGSIAAAMGVASLVNARFVRRYGMHRISHASIIAFLLCAVAQVALALAYRGHPPLVALLLALAAGQFLASLAMPNFNALAMEPLGKIAGTASSLIGFYTTVLGVAAGLIVGRAFNGSVLPLGLGYVALAAIAVAAVMWTERGRLFRSHDRAAGGGEHD